MSSSFKFLNKSQGDTSNQSAAQDFLNEKLSNNRFTQEQQTRLDANGGPTVANATGDEYQKQDFTEKADAATADPNSVAENSNPFAIKGDGTNNDEMYTSGKWGKGSMTPEQIAEKFGLERTSARNADGGHKDGDIWGTDATGNKVYIGSVTDEGSLRGNSELISAHSAQAHQDEGDHNALGEELSSSGDVNGALLNLWDGSGGEIKEVEKPKVEELPVEHSPEIEQAKERVRSYEDDALSGKTSADIYGGNFDFDATKGAAGIGTPMNGSSQEQASKATASFLDNKKSQVKKQYQFKAQG
jgi:hypothetical protein